MRMTPRFDFGTLNRRRALSVFESLSIKYLDLGLKEPTLEASLAAIDPVSKDVMISAQRIASNIVVFVDAEPDYREVGRAIGRHVKEKTSTDWEVVLRGPEEAPKSSRRVIFISHANPEDNSFVLWLQAQLQRLGYEVWSDLSRLRAGEVFWDSIESAIRNDAFRVVVVVSEASMRKDGVLDEIALAVSVERSERIPGFVVPIKIDKAPYASLRANIARKNVLDFSDGWGKGLTALVGSFRRDSVPRGTGRLNEMLRILKQDPAPTSLKNIPEVLTSNRFEVTSTPSKLYFMSGRPTRNDATEDGAIPPILPVTPHRGGWLTFFSPAEIRAHGFEGLHPQSTLSTDEFCAGNVGLSAGLRADERQRLMTRILNAHLNFSLLMRGLLLLPDSLPPTLYVPHDLLEKDQVTFTDVDGRSHRRNLVGRSERRQLFWHLGLTVRYLQIANCIQVRLRVIFTTDGLNATVSADRMKEARRSFCKNWWNDRWRSLELALVSWLAGGANTISVHAGEAGRLEVSALPQQFSVPVSIDDALLSSVVEIDAEEPDDAYADYELRDIDDDSHIQ